MIFNVTPGEDVKFGEGRHVDNIAIDLLAEVKSRLPELEEFQAYLEAAPLGNEYEPGPEHQFNGMEQLRDMSRNNYAKLIVDATADRLGILGFQTAASNDEFGDQVVAEAFEKDGMDSKAQEAMGLACGYRTSYLVVDPVTHRQLVIPPTGAAVMTDVNGEPVGAITVHHERALKRDVLRVYARPVNELTGEADGEVFMAIATKESTRRTRDLNPRLNLKLTRYDSEVPLNGAIETGWTWWKTPAIKVSRIPVTALNNRDGRNEFELHTDIINRINHMIFQRVIIATMQAFRQRAIIGDLPDFDPETGEKIDYAEMFLPGPDQLWKLPKESTFWESTPPSFQDILSAVDKDEKNLGSETYTPMNYFSDAVNSSAEGASLQRENYLSKIEDRKRRFGAAWTRHISILFESRGDKERSNAQELSVIWAPTNVDTLNERTAAFSSMRSTGLALSTSLREGMGFTPRQIKQAKQEATREAVDQRMMDAINQTTPLSKSSRAQDGANSSSLVAQNTGTKKEA